MSLKLTSRDAHAATHHPGRTGRQHPRVPEPVLGGARHRWAAPAAADRAHRGPDPHHHCVPCCSRRRHGSAAPPLPKPPAHHAPAAPNRHAAPAAGPGGRPRATAVSAPGRGDGGAARRRPGIARPTAPPDAAGSPATDPGKAPAKGAAENTARPKNRRAKSAATSPRLRPAAVGLSGAEASARPQCYEYVMKIRPAVREKIRAAPQTRVPDRRSGRPVPPGRCGSVPSARQNRRCRPCG